jgi:hypothetical protein
MIDQIKEFFSENSMMIILAVVGMIAIVAIFMFRNHGKNAEAPEHTPVPTPSHDLEGMDNLNMVCDLANGICHPQNITPEQEQQAMEAAPVEYSEQ